MYRIINLDNLQLDYKYLEQKPILEGNYAIDTFLDTTMLDGKKLYTNDVLKYKNGPYQNLLFKTTLVNNKCILENIKDPTHLVPLEECYLGDLERISSFYKWKTNNR